MRHKLKANRPLTGSPKRRGGFTLTELLVLVGTGAVLTGLLAADLSQTRAKLLQQACAANLKHWGMAIDLYTQDYSGTYFYSLGSMNFDDSGTFPTTPYVRYFGGGDPAKTIRSVRICPSVAAKMTQDALVSSPLHTYSMPIPTVSSHGFYSTLQPAPPNGGIFPSLKAVPYPSQYLLLIDSKGNTLRCGGLRAAVTQINSMSGDSIPAVDRHEGGVNCLFGDFHVEWVSSQTISNQDAIDCRRGNPWFMMN